jgi:hypothetical protein
MLRVLAQDAESGWPRIAGPRNLAAAALPEFGIRTSNPKASGPGLGKPRKSSAAEALRRQGGGDRAEGWVSS